MFRKQSEYEKLNQMLDDAIAGKFEESLYDESELSKLQIKWKQYLSMQKQDARKLDQERKNLKELITNVSHQTKTPLTNILLYAQLLEEQTEDETGRQYANQIMQSSKKLEQLLEALVKMSRLETGIFTYHVKKQKLGALVEQIAAEGIPKAKQKHIQILTQKESEAEAVFDLKWSAEAAYNILDNAIKYAPEKSRIRISLFQYELFAGIEICDEGSGIPEDELPRIFMRFYRGKNAQKEEGIGVGLFLARQITEGQNGYIQVISKPGKGSRFQIFYPRA